MYDDIIHLAMDQQLLTEIRDRNNENYKKLPLIKELQKFDDNYTEIEQQLTKTDEIKFDNIFHEPVGYHLIKEFLRTQHSVDKAIFLSDVELYKNLNDPMAREQVAQKIFDTFCAPEIFNRKKGQSVFKSKHDINTNNVLSDNNNETKNDGDIKDDTTTINNDNNNDINNDDTSNFQLSLLTENTNIIGVYGRPLKKLEETLSKGFPSKNVFDSITAEVYDDLRLDIFPRFCKSKHFKMYLKCKQMENRTITVKDFHQMRVLGRGAFGVVNACKKKDTGTLYAMKQINKRRVQATDSTESIMAERNFLSYMDSDFVTGLKYSFQDDETLYLILDLMIGGDLKYHLNNEKTFNEERSKFYAAEVLLGLEHVHSKGIIYRDLKLENILVDDKGHVKISDLGLSVIVMTEENKEEILRNQKKPNPNVTIHGIRGYAGTPGYTAPEVVLSHYYKHIVDFFSLGVMIYRFLCGKKPFQSKKRHRGQGHRQHDQRRATAELDRNVVEMEPDFPHQYFSPESKSLLKGLLCKNHKRRLGYKGIHEIKNHPWFDSIDFGMLEAGYINSPYVPSLDEIHAEQQNAIGPPPQDEKFIRIKITQEFENSLKGFRFQSKKVIQEEIVDVLKKVTNERRASNIDELNLFDFGGSGDVLNRNGDSCMGTCNIL